MDSARLRELLSGVTCPLCGGDRGETLLIVIDSPTEDAASVRVQCVRCRIHWSYAGTQPEASGPARPVREPISADEVIEVHRLLQHMRGSLTDCLREAG